MPLRPLRDITAPAHRPHLRWAILVRWLAVGGFSLLAAVAWHLGTLAAPLPCLFAAAAAAAVNALNQWCVRQGRALRTITALAIVADVLLITFLIVRTGGAASPFVMLYVVQVVATALLVDLWIAAAAALASAGGLTAALAAGWAVAPTAPAAGSTVAQLVWSLFLLYCLGLLTFLGGYIAERLRGTERRLRATEAQLVHSEKLRALGQFVAGVAHELNNPLAVVTANLDYIRRATVAMRAHLDRGGAAPRPAGGFAELPAVLDDCAEGARRAAAIVAGLRAFARGDAEPACAPVDVGARIDSALALLRHRLGAAIAVRREGAPLPPIECRCGQIDQVLLNLLANAVDALPAGGTITVRTALLGGRAAIAIGDDGRGIAPALRARVFEPFFTTKPEGQGTGLGLSVSYGIVERHGGTLSVDSTPGRGATFTITLPLRQD